MRRGRERYDIFCSPCHGLTGEGDGMVVQRGYRRPPSFHVDRLRQAPPGHLFDVMTNGFGAMPDYAAQIPVRDRWAIAAYMRALQLSQNATRRELSPEAQGQLEMNVQAERTSAQELRSRAQEPAVEAAHRGRRRRGGVRDRIRDEPGAVRALVPAGVHVAAVDHARLARPCDGSPGVGRRVGRGHSAHPRRGDAHAAAADRSVHSDRARPALALSVGRRGARRRTIRFCSGSSPT